MTYDHWKATNPADEWLGPEPRDRDDMSACCAHAPSHEAMKAAADRVGARATSNNKPA
jgi:hypothetical protein